MIMVPPRWELPPALLPPDEPLPHALAATATTAAYPIMRPSRTVPSDRRVRTAILEERAGRCEAERQGGRVSRRRSACQRWSVRGLGAWAVQVWQGLRRVGWAGGAPWA